MFAITLTEKGGDQRRLDFDKAEITIGRVQGNDVVLPKGNVSKRHARIVLKDGKFIIVDLKSTNGTYVNGRKITSPLVVKDSDKIYIGDFILGVEDPEQQPTGAQRAASQPSVPPPAAPAPAPAPAPAMAPPPAAPAPAMAPPPAAALPRAMPSAPPPLAPASSPRAATAAPPPARPAAAPPRPAPRPMAPPPSAPVAMAPQPMAPLPMAPPPAAPMMAPPPIAAPPRAAAPPQPVTPPPAAPVMAPPPAMAPISHSEPLDLGVEDLGSADIPTPEPEPTPEPSIEPETAKPRLVGAGALNAMRKRPPMDNRRVAAVPGLDAGSRALLDIQDSILERLVPDLGLDDLPLDRLGDEELWQRAESAIVDLVETMESGGSLPGGVDQDQLIKETLNEALGLGPLEDLLADDSVEEIIVDGVDRILTMRSGALGSANTGFSSEDVFRRVIDRLMAPTGLAVDDNRPIVNARLRDGALLSIVLPPVSSRGPCLTLRKPSGRGADLRGLEARGVLDEGMASFLGTCLIARKSIVVCGAVRSGRNSVLGALASDVPANERLISIEEVSSLKIGRPHWIALETRSGNGAGSGVTVSDLLESAVRMHPDRLVVGDVRGAEAFDLAQVMLGSFDGTLTSMRGEGALAALTCFASLTGLACTAETSARRELVSAAVDVVVHVVRYGDGKVRIASIDEVVGTGATGFETQNIFRYDESGEHVASGVVPSFYEELGAHGVAADSSVFGK